MLLALQLALPQPAIGPSGVRESVEQLLRGYTLMTGDSAEQVYARWAGLSTTADSDLEDLVRRKLVANGKSGQLREGLLATIKAGGAVGETTEACLLASGLTGWS